MKFGLNRIVKIAFSVENPAELLFNMNIYRTYSLEPGNQKILPLARKCRQIYKKTENCYNGFHDLTVSKGRVFI